jgi:hypothetical protein
VSVTERTREIGIRKAIGARRGDILTQFLCEAVLVSLIGGIIGMLVGVVGSQFEIAGVHPAIATYSIFLAFGAAALSGLFFGTYPPPARPQCDLSKRCTLSEEPSYDQEHPMSQEQVVDEQREWFEDSSDELPRRPRRRLLGVGGNPVPLLLIGVLRIACGSSAACSLQQRRTCTVR